MVNWLFKNSKTIFTFKKQVAIATCFLIISIFSFGQNNLVPNPGFDTVKISCPGVISDITKWYSPNGNTPDIHHYCASRISPSVSSGVPQNAIGYQYPLTDSVYIGIVLYHNKLTDNREYVAVRLKETLEKGYVYCLEFNISLSDSSNYAISSIGGYFSTDSVFGNCCLLNYQPQIQNDSVNIITDTSKWIKITGNYIANGGERYLTIGNFYNDSFTEKNYLKIANNLNTSFHISDFSYYYIDNVSVYACDSLLEEEPQDTTFIFIPNVFSPNQDGENDLWQVTAQKVNSLNIQVVNRWGEQVYSFNSAQLSTLDIQPSTSQLSTFNPAWDGYTPTGKPVPEGTYFYIVQYTLPSGETKVEKGYVTLVR